MKTAMLDTPLDPDTAASIALDIRPVELTTRSRDSMRDRIVRRAAQSAPIGTTTLRDTEGVWIELTRGVRKKVMNEDPVSGTQTYLVSMTPGSKIPGHPHALDEHCFVVEGEAWIGDHLLRRGDWHVAKAGATHGELFSRTGCVLLIRSETHSV